MKIKQTKKGWEYDGITFVDEASARAAKAANDSAPPPAREPAGTEVVLIYDNEQPTSFGSFVTAYLRVSDTGIIKLAENIGVSKQALFDWINGKSIPSRKHLQAIMTITKCSVTDLQAALHDNFEMQKKKLFEDLKDQPSTAS